MKAAAVIVTRGDVDLEPILATHRQARSIAFTYIWNNALWGDLGVYGRYAALDRFDYSPVIVQDDDVLLPAETLNTLVDLYEPGMIVANMPQEFRRPWYTEHCLVGFGAVFERGLPAQAFEQLFPQLINPVPWEDWQDYRFTHNGVSGVIPDGATFRRTCDVIFTALTPFRIVDLPMELASYARDDNRMYAQRGFHEERMRMLDLCLAIKAQAA